MEGKYLQTLSFMTGIKEFLGERALFDLPISTCEERNSANCLSRYRIIIKNSKPVAENRRAMP